MNTHFKTQPDLGFFCVFFAVKAEVTVFSYVKRAVGKKSLCPLNLYIFLFTWKKTEKNSTTFVFKQYKKVYYYILLQIQISGLAV